MVRMEDDNPKTAKSNANMDDPGSPLVGTDKAESARAKECKSDRKPRCKRSRTERAKPGHTGDRAAAESPGHAGSISANKSSSQDHPDENSARPTQASFRESSENPVCR